MEQEVRDRRAEELEALRAGADPETLTANPEPVPDDPQ